MRIILLGLPGSGKEELARRLSKEYDIPVLTLEKTLADMTAQKTELGRLVKEAALAGKFSDELIMAAVRVRLAQEDAQNGFVLEDFPRSLGQAETLDVLLKALCTPLNAVVKIDIESDDLMEHLVGRITCQHCGEKYNIYSNPPIVEGMCNECGERIRRRPDDYEENIANRLRNCEVIMSPLLTYYKGKNNLHLVDGNHPDKKIVRLAMKMLNNLPEPEKPECAEDMPELPMDETLLKVLSPPKPVYDENRPRKRGRPRRKPLPEEVVEPAAETKAKAVKEDTSDSKAQAKAVDKKPVVKKTAAKKTATKKVVAKKTASKKTATKKAPVKKTASKPSALTKKKVVKKSASKKAATKKKVVKKTAGKKAVTSKKAVTTKKTPSKKIASKKVAAKKVSAKKSASKKAPAKKAAVKKTVAKKKAAKKK